MRKRGKIVLIFTPIAFAAIFVIALILVRTFRTPPFEILLQAANSIEKAKREGSENYAADPLALAESLLVAGENKFSQLDSKWYLLPSYQPAISILKEAISNAELAAKLTAENRAFEQMNISQLVSDLSENIAAWEDKLNSQLNLMDCRKIFLRAKAESEVAGHLLNAGEFQMAKLSAEKANMTLAELDRVHTGYDRHREKRMDIWDKWISETIQKSKLSAACAIIVDKSAHKLYLLSAGRIIKSYSCDLGFNSGHGKMRKGDGATPEGMYHITKVMNVSKYYKALRLNYPNRTDREKFAMNKRAGLIAANAGIGGLIEIHGNGGTARDWTDGCVAISNRNMDDLIKNAGVGMPVTIVGKSELAR